MTYIEVAHKVYVLVQEKYASIKVYYSETTWPAKKLKIKYKSLVKHMLPIEDWFPSSDNFHTTFYTAYTLQTRHHDQ